jgi:hypothetical protein
MFVFSVLGSNFLPSSKELRPTQTGRDSATHANFQFSKTNKTVNG